MKDLDFSEEGLWIFDTEGDGLLDEITQFWCLCFKSYRQNRWVVFLDENHPEAKDAYSFCINIRSENITVKRISMLEEWLCSDDVKAIGCHFMFGFDLPAMDKLLGLKSDYFSNTIGKASVGMYDTLSMSRNLYPDRPHPSKCPMKIRCPVTGKMKTIGSHGLQAWGYRVGVGKPQIDDWRNQPLTTYIHRCLEDVEINERTFTKLKEEMFETESHFKVDWVQPLSIGMATDYLMSEQERDGVLFDVKAAEKLRDKIDQMMKEIEEDIEPQLPERLLPKSERPTFPANPFKGNGEIGSHGYNWLRKLGYEFEEELFDVVPPPKTAFKQNGELSNAGINYCTKQGVTDEEQMPDFIRSQRTVSEKCVFIGGKDAEYKGIQDLRDKRLPKMTVPMKLSNQMDIKKYLVEVEGWRPTMMGTRKGFDVDDRKQKLPENILRVKLKKYIQDIIDSPFRDFVYADLDCKPFHTYPVVDGEQPKLIDLLMRKARYLPSTPKFKDERGELCPSLEMLKGDMAKQIVKWLSLRNRRSVIEATDENKDTGWLNNTRLLSDGRLGAGATGLTNTFRMKHFNVVNVPKADPSVLLGKEMRSLFIVPDDCWQIGTDASNLEGFVAAWTAWNFDNGDYYRGLSGDPHTTNAEAYSEAAGKFVSRGDGKAITYGVLYGAQAAKVAAMLGISKDKAQAVIDAFWDTNYGLKEAKERLEKYWEKTGKKFIRGIDGRKIYTRSKHSLLNAYIQSTGAILMSIAGIKWHIDFYGKGFTKDAGMRTVFMHRQNCAFVE